MRAAYRILAPGDTMAANPAVESALHSTPRVTREPSSNVSEESDRVIWEVNFAEYSMEDWTGMVNSRVINGATFTIENVAKAATFGPDGSKGLVAQLNAAGPYLAGVYTALQLSTKLSDAAITRNKNYVWRMIMAADSAIPAGLGEGFFGGIRVDRTQAGGDAHHQVLYTTALTGRLIRGGSNNVDRALSAVTMADPRTIDVVLNGGRSVVARVSESAESDAIAGTALAEGMLSGAALAAASAVPPLDLSDSDAEVYFGFLGRTVGTTGSFIAQKLQLLATRG